MKRVLVTGSKGFLGKNLLEVLSRQKNVETFEFDIDDSDIDLKRGLGEADVIYHLAGVNRPESVEDFHSGNVYLTRKILSILSETRGRPKFVLSSSTQAELDNPYGLSKRAAEDLVFKFGEETGAPVYVYRLTNVFGKWCRPNYNSVVATFCYNIANNLNIVISDESKILELIYIDDVVKNFLGILDAESKCEQKYLKIEPSYKITLGRLVTLLYELRDIRKTLIVPNFADDFTRYLYATFISYLDKNDFSYDLDTIRDQRGSLAELIKSKQFGQVFISKSYGRIVRGNHYHNTKIEKFCVIHGKAVIRFRHILSGDEVLSYRVSGDDLKIVDIPPGYTHSIENLSDDEMIVLFWANEIFDPDSPDTYSCEVTSK